MKIKHLLLHFQLPVDEWIETLKQILEKQYPT